MYKDLITLVFNPNTGQSARALYLASAHRGTHRAERNDLDAELLKKRSPVD